MKRLLIGILCGIPLALFGAENSQEFKIKNVGGFDVEINGDGIVMKEIRGGYYFGEHNARTNEFRLMGKIIGNDKAWCVVSFDKGKKLIGIASWIQLVQFDCVNMRSRSLNSTEYRGYFLDGGLKSYNDKISSWSYGLPGSINEYFVSEFCSGVEAVQRFNKSFKRNPYR